MTMGTAWNEYLPWGDPQNDEYQMTVVPDLYQYILDRPLVAAPGERWTYNGGATSVMGAMISRATGKSLHEYAKEQLFGPLGITEVEWVARPNGESLAAWGLRMRPRDLAKIGQLVLQRGRWGDRQVVPAAWLDEATAPHAEAEPLLRYGYQWWLGGSAFGDGQTPWIAAFGRGGQRLTIVPELELVVVVTAGNYFMPENCWRLPVAILTQFVLPALVAAPRDQP
jgi:CubicO group peptidase (beta-lactamase class C family)